MQYRLNEAVGRPFNSTVNGARMIGSGVFDRYPKLQVLIVHMGGELESILGRLEFTGTSTTKESATHRRAGITRTNARHPTTSRPTSWSTVWGSIQLDCELRLRCAVRTEWYSAPITVRCLTESRSMSGLSKMCFRARLSVNRCSGKQATDYSAWA